VVAVAAVQQRRLHRRLPAAASDYLCADYITVYSALRQLFSVCYAIVLFAFFSTLGDVKLKSANHLNVQVVKVFT
jgi:hypothetical protein